MPENHYKILFQIPLISGITSSILIPALVIFLLFSSSENFLDLPSLSQLGERGSETAVIFNFSIIISGTLLIVFAIGLIRNSSLIGKSGIGIFIFSALSLVSVGILNIPHNFHNFSAVIFFGALPTSLLFMGLRIIKSSKGHRAVKSLQKIGYGTLGLGIAIWSLNILITINPLTISITFFELIITFISSFWLLGFGRKLLCQF